MLSKRIGWDNQKATDIAISQGHDIAIPGSQDLHPGTSDYTVALPSSPRERSMRRKALNRACKIGQLYSGVKDEIMPEFMFLGEIPDSALMSVDTQQTYLTWEEEFSAEDKFKSLEVEGELKLSVLLGITEIEGASKYITSVTKSSTCVRICLVYRVSTREETLNFQHEDVPKLFRLEALQDTPATHVVVGIQWGYSGVIAFEQSVTEHHDRDTIEKSLKGTLRLGLASTLIGQTISSKLSPVKLGAGFTPTAKTATDENLKRRSVKIIADIMPQTAIEPNDFQSAIEFARSIGDANHITINGGRGKPQEIHLLSLEAVCQRLRASSIVQGLFYRTLSRNIMLAVEKELEKLADMMQMLNLTFGEVEDRAKRLRIPQLQLTNFEANRNDLQIGTTRFRGQLRDLLVEVRSGQKKEQEIEIFLGQFQSTKYSSAGMRDQLSSLKSYQENITFLETLCSQGVEILGEDSDPESLVADHVGVSSLYILCYDDKDRIHRSAAWINNFKLFEDLIKDQEGSSSKLFLLNYSEGRFWDRGPDVTIMLYRGGIWDGDYLQTVQSTRLSNDEINILLLGQTGMGKSTFVNAFYNYISYDSLEQAQQAGVKVAVPSQFTEVDQSLNTQKIAVGDNSLEDENFEDSSQSSTQRCKSYLFNIEPESNKLGVSIRLIDTPGIGDTRGEEWDKKNFENIVLELKKYTHIHGVCIFLKPNESRLSMMLEYSIMELLVHLHKNASRNMVFCFTSAKSTNFHVGYTLKPLRALLENIQRKKQVRIQISESTMYCFDNEAFRYLAARQELQGQVQAVPPVRSWNQSVKECIRLLSQFNSVGAHLIEETVSVIRVKQIVESLEEPLVNLSGQIIENSNLIKEKRKEIEETEEDLEALKKIIMRPTGWTEPSMVKQHHLRTECTSAACTTMRTDSNGRTVTSHRVCHDPCTGRESSWRIVERVRLRHCSHMINGRCIGCRCRTRDHKFVRYEIQTTGGDARTSQDQRFLQEGMNAALVKKSALKLYQKRVDDLEKEKAFINDAQLRFACFLQEDSFTSATNDYKCRYLEREITQLELKLRSQTSMELIQRRNLTTKIGALKLRAEKYKKELKEFAEFLKKEPRNADEISIEKIKSTLEGLTRLPYSSSVFASKLAMDDDEDDLQIDDSSLEFQIDWSLEREETAPNSLASKLVTMALHRQRSQ